MKLTHGSSSLMLNQKGQLRQESVCSLLNAVKQASCVKTRDCTNIGAGMMVKGRECHRYGVLVLSNTSTRGNANLGRDGRQCK